MTNATILGGISGSVLTREEAAFFRAADPWGFILFARNIGTPDEVRRLTGALREAVGRNAVVTVDQEGGRVQRLRRPHWTDWGPPLDQQGGARAMWLRHRLIGAELRAVGIDSDCAPTLDLACPDTHPFLRNRCLADDPLRVAELGRAAAEGLLEAGVLPVMKHLPGHGRARVDSHHETPEVAQPLADLETTDFAPFRALADLPMAMTAHIRLTALTDTPATASPEAIALIRDRIGFRGLLMTDDIDMQALTGTPAERAAAAIAAGCDLVLHCNGTLADMESVVAAAGVMIPAAVARGDAALASRLTPAPVDLAALRAEYDALSPGSAVWGEWMLGDQPRVA